MSLLHLDNISKHFNQGAEVVKVIDSLTFSIQKGEAVALVGASGSGKSTFLSIAGLLETPNNGKIFFHGKDCSLLSDNARTEIRRNNIGFIYQFHHLLPEFTALENVILPRMLLESNDNKCKQQAQNLLELLGMGHRLSNFPSELSGGEQQRVAIARSLINEPELILADEPTGNLDNTNATKVIDLILHEARTREVAVIIVTHNVELAKKADKVFTMMNGKIVEQFS